MGLSNRTFGVEIECFGPVSHWELTVALIRAGFKVQEPDTGWYSNSESRLTGWDIKDDCSIRPTGRRQHSYELASPILKGEKGLREVRRLCSALKKLGITVNKSCGIHVHVGATKDSNKLEPSEIYNIVKRYAAHEDEIDNFIGDSRRKNKSEWCRSAQGTRIDIIRAYDQYKKYNMDSYGRSPNPFASSDRLAWLSGRGSKVNLNALNSHGTIEFRHHHGSVCGTEITNWIKFLLNFVERSRELTTVRNARGKVTRPARRSRDTGALLGLPTAARQHLKARVGARYLQAA